MVSMPLAIYNNPSPLPPLISLPLLGVSEVEIIAAEVKEPGELIIHLESTVESVACHKCQRVVNQGHGSDEPITVRHLSVFGLKTYLKLRPKRFACPYCAGQVTTTQQVSWRYAYSPQSKAYEAHILMQLVNSTVQDVSRKEDLGYDAVLGIVDRYLARQVDWSQFERLGVLGIDEITLKKGHQDYVAVIIARLPNQQLKVLAVLPDRKKKTVLNFLRAIPKRLQKTIHSVCTDMWPHYISAVKEALSQAKIIVDRFHVAQHYHQAADDLRKQVLKRLKQELSETDYEALKKTMWPFRKQPADLTDAEVARLAHLLERSSSLRLAYLFRLELTAIFEADLTKAQATEKIEAWIAQVQASELTCFDPFLNTLNNHLDEITNYFLKRHTSGFVEGLNNKLKVLKRRCYGIFNLGHLFQRLSLDLYGYSLFPSFSPFPTPRYGPSYGNS
jgi:transposase